MVTSKRGRLSSADRERIHALAEKGKSIAEISRDVERRPDVIEAILGAKKLVARGRKPRMDEDERPVPVARIASAPRRDLPRDILEHQLWVRPGVQITLSLPGDFNEYEAERLAVMVRNLPFSG